MENIVAGFSPRLGHPGAWNGICFKWNRGNHLWTGEVYARRDAADRTSTQYLYGLVARQKSGHSGTSLLYFQEDDVVIVKSQDIILSFQRRQGIYSYDAHFGKEREARTHRVQNLLLLVA
jgi:hypothetical protein